MLDARAVKSAVTGFWLRPPMKLSSKMRAPRCPSLSDGWFGIACERPIKHRGLHRAVTGKTWKGGKE